MLRSVDGAYEIADSDRKTFFTKAGRPVKDGGGEEIEEKVFMLRERMFLLRFIFYTDI